MPYFPEFPDDATQSDIFRHWPELAEPLGLLAQRLMREGPIDSATAELLFAYVSGLNACRYCHGIHRTTAEQLGVDPALFEAIMQDPQTDAVAPRLRPLLAYLRKLTEAPASVGSADADAVFAAGWSGDEVHYALSICALANYFNRILEGHGIHGNPALWESRGRLLADNAYTAVHRGRYHPEAVEGQPEGRTG